MKLLAARANSVRVLTENIPSPCLSVCKMDVAADLCQGCLRSIGEIRDWSTRTDEEKKMIWARIEERLQAQAGTSP